MAATAQIFVPKGQRSESSLLKKLLLQITELVITETKIGQFLPNYRGRDWSFEITETDYRAQVLATMPTFASRYLGIWKLKAN